MGESPSPHSALPSAAELFGSFAGLQDAVYVKDAQGTYLMVNEAAADIFGRPVEKIVGARDSELLPDGAVEQREVDRRVMETGESVSVEEPVVLHDEPRTFLTTKAPLHDAEGGVVGVVGVSTCITERKRAEEGVRAHEAQLAEAQALTGAGSWEIDVRTGQVCWSANLYRIYGQCPDEFTPTYETVMQCIPEADRDRVDRAARAAIAGEAELDVEHRVLRPDGEERTVRSAARVFHDVDGTPLRLVGSALDVTEARRVERELRHQRDQLEIAQALTGVGSFEWAVEDDIVTWSDSLYRIFGREPGDFEGTYDAYLELVHPEDREERQEVIARVLRTGEDADDVHRIVRADGEVRWLRTRVTLRRGGDGLRLVGACQDVSEDYHSAAQLERRAEHGVALAQLGTRALRELTIEELVDQMERTLSERLHVDAIEVWSLEPDERRFLLGGARGLPEDTVARTRLPALGSYVGSAYHGDELIVVRDWQNEPRFPYPEHLEGTGLRASAAAPLRGYGASAGALAVHACDPGALDDIDLELVRSVARLAGQAIERQRESEDVKRQALEDPLTGVPNRTLVYDRLRHAIEVGRRRRTTLAVLFVDLDEFRLVNDRLGHSAGDDLLREAAQRIDSSLRGTDTVARLGGDEFLVVCEESGSTLDAVDVGERIRAAFAAPFDVGGQEKRLTASIGLTLSRGRETEPGELIGEADRAMYAAKARGGDCVEVYRQPSP